ncbi:sulfite exporter TauE/SafE family protein [Halobacillus litoralis]|uniref:sulfite exporter TauE/SafE family protein n=1 Tax=Halobacillus litoralis TaxID=45668 RepID=UPI00273FB640|nr:sulfite exporter TauE/SafE family protein [Halobacillus litoralis]WLR46993.1 sulfite exporter TauE/SafE family protein [Halobacillus litoralis]
MHKLTIFTLIGFIAQLMDGALGMGFGLSSSTILLSYGLAPAVASASIHMSQIATTAVSGFSHYKFGNIDKRLVMMIAVHGAISAFLGAAFLSYIPGEFIRPYISIFLLTLGVYIVVRFLCFSRKTHVNEKKSVNKRFLLPLGIAGGFLDSVGGGGWGPVNTPALLSQSGIAPRKVIGTVDTSEFLVTISATAGFLIFLGHHSFSWLLIASFVIGGVIAAPIAAWLVKILPSAILGVLAGGFIILTNARTLLSSIQVSDSTLMFVYTLLISGYLLIVFVSIKNHLRVKMVQKQT